MEIVRLGITMSDELEKHLKKIVAVAEANGSTLSLSHLVHMLVIAGLDLQEAALTDETAKRIWEAAKDASYGFMDEAAKRRGVHATVAREENRKAAKEGKPEPRREKTSEEIRELASKHIVGGPYPTRVRKNKKSADNKTQEGKKANG